MDKYSDAMKLINQEMPDNQELACVNDILEAYYKSQKPLFVEFMLCLQATVRLTHYVKDDFHHAIIDPKWWNDKGSVIDGRDYWPIIEAYYPIANIGLRIGLFITSFTDEEPKRRFSPVIIVGHTCKDIDIVSHLKSHLDISNFNDLKLTLSKIKCVNEPVFFTDRENHFYLAVVRENSLSNAIKAYMDALCRMEHFYKNYLNDITSFMTDEEARQCSKDCISDLELAFAKDTTV